MRRTKEQVWKRFMRFTQRKFDSGLRCCEWCGRYRHWRFMGKGFNPEEMGGGPFWICKKVARCDEHKLWYCVGMKCTGHEWVEEVQAEKERRREGNIT